MFYQVKVPEDQCSFLRILWWDDCDTNKEIIDYEIKAHVFGGTSSPSCSNFALRKTASDNKNKYVSGITRILEVNFYMDDTFQTLVKLDIVRLST